MHNIIFSFKHGVFFQALLCQYVYLSTIYTVCKRRLFVRFFFFCIFYIHRLLMSSLFYANRIYCDTIYLKVCLKDIYVQKCVLNVFQNEFSDVHVVVFDSHSQFESIFPSIFSLPRVFFFLSLPLILSLCMVFNSMSFIRAQPEEQQWTSVVLFWFIFFFTSAVEQFFFFSNSAPDTRYLWIGRV